MSIDRSQCEGSGCFLGASTPQALAVRDRPAAQIRPPGGRVVGPPSRFKKRLSGVNPRLRPGRQHRPVDVARRVRRARVLQLRQDSLSSAAQRLSRAFSNAHHGARERLEANVVQEGPERGLPHFQTPDATGASWYFSRGGPSCQRIRACTSVNWDPADDDSCPIVLKVEWRIMLPPDPFVQEDNCVTNESVVLP